MKTDEEILYEIYHSYELKTYERIKIAFENKDFDYLQKNGHPYTKKTRKEINLQSSNINEVIEELKGIKEKAHENEGFLNVEGDLDENGNPVICITSILYDMRPITACESSAKFTVKWNIWKLKNQPNGIDAKRLRERIDKYKSEINKG